MKPHLTAGLFLAMLTLLPAVQATEKIGTFGPDSFRQIVASHQGRPFAVMVWSLDCEYCQASFAALAQAKRSSGLTVVSIATDRADDPQAAQLIAKKLQAAGLIAENWAFGPAPAEQLRYAIDPKWRGEMPRSYWFDGHGKVVAHSGVITSGLVSKLRANQ